MSRVMSPMSSNLIGLTIAILIFILSLTTLSLGVTFWKRRKAVGARYLPAIVIQISTGYALAGVPMLDLGFPCRAARVLVTLSPSLFMCPLMILAVRAVLILHTELAKQAASALTAPPAALNRLRTRRQRHSNATIALLTCVMLAMPICLVILDESTIQETGATFCRPGIGATQHLFVTFYTLATLVVVVCCVLLCRHVSGRAVMIVCVEQLIFMLFTVALTAALTNEAWNASYLYIILSTWWQIRFVHLPWILVRGSCAKSWTGGSGASLSQLVTITQGSRRPSESRSRSRTDREGSRNRDFTFAESTYAKRNLVFAQLLQSRAGFEAYLAESERIFSSELPLFFRAVEYFKDTPTLLIALTIQERYIDTNGMLAINISSAVLRRTGAAVIKAVERGEANTDPGLFDDAQRAVVVLMKANLRPSFRFPKAAYTAVSKAKKRKQKKGLAKRLSLATGRPRVMASGLPPRPLATSTHRRGASSDHSIQLDMRPMGVPSSNPTSLTSSGNRPTPSSSRSVAGSLSIQPTDDSGQSSRISVQTTRDDSGQSSGMSSPTTMSSPTSKASNLRVGRQMLFHPIRNASLSASSRRESTCG